MKRFEYMRVNQRAYQYPQFVAELNELGLKGWELCGFDYGCLWLKRELPGTANASQTPNSTTPEAT